MVVLINDIIIRNLVQCTGVGFDAQSAATVPEAHTIRPFLSCYRDKASTVYKLYDLNRKSQIWERQLDRAQKQVYRPWIISSNTGTDICVCTANAMTKSAHLRRLISTGAELDDVPYQDLKTNTPAEILDIKSAELASKKRYLSVLTEQDVHIYEWR